MTEKENMMKKEEIVMLRIEEMMMGGEEVMPENLSDILHSGHHSLVVLQGGVHTFGGRGVSDLYRLWRENAALLHGAAVADKVVGKGAAALMALMNVSVLYADVISHSALELLRRAGVEVHPADVVPHIINRAGTGRCPLETRCAECVTPEECLVEIENFMHHLNNKNQ